MAKVKVYKRGSLLENIRFVIKSFKEVKMTQGYCVKCKKMTDMKDPKESLTKKGTKIAKGKCPTCGTTVCRMGGLK